MMPARELLDLRVKGQFASFSLLYKPLIHF